jgi:hypothetical protein
VCHHFPIIRYCSYRLKMCSLLQKYTVARPIPQGITTTVYYSTRARPLYGVTTRRSSDFATNTLMVVQDTSIFPLLLLPPFLLRLSLFRCFSLLR